MTSGKRPWYLRLVETVSQTATVVSMAASVPDGFTRQVRLAFVMDEPGKGGTHPPQRDLHVRLNPNDADALALEMLSEAQRARRTNHQQGDGGQYTDHWPTPASDPDRRMDLVTAQQIAKLTAAATDRIAAWEADYDGGDYRVSDALFYLRQAQTALALLVDDKHPASRAEAQAKLREQGIIGDGGTQ